MKKTNICLIFCVIIIAVLIFFIVKPPIDGGGGPRGKDYGLTVTEYKNRLKNKIDEELTKVDNDLRTSIQNNYTLNSLKVSSLECTTREQTDYAGKKGSNIVSIDVRVTADISQGGNKGKLVHKWIVVPENDRFKILESKTIAAAVFKGGRQVAPNTDETIMKISNGLTDFGKTVMVYLPAIAFLL